MKILFTGPLLDFSGFAHAARTFLKMLNESDVELTARPLRYDQLDPGQAFKPEPWLSDLLLNDLQNVDMCIQTTTCNVEAVLVPGVCNGLYTFFESDRLQVAWAQKANEFDFLIVPCKANAEALLRSGVTRPIVVCNPACDVDTYKELPYPFAIDNVGDRTVFYNICQLSTKKGIDILLRAYYTAFADMPDAALLVLKTYVNMGNRQNDIQTVKQYIEQVRMRCRIPTNTHPPVLPLVYTMTDDEINSLHSAGHAYVCTSRAEGWGIPVFDALAFGKTVISHQQGGLNEFVKDENSLLLRVGMATTFYDAPHSDPGLFTGLEQCYETSPAELAMVMRRYHLLRTAELQGMLDDQTRLEWGAITQRRENGRLQAEKFDYRNIHSKVVPQLDAAFNSWKSTGTVTFDQSKATVHGNPETAEASQV